MILDERIAQDLRNWYKTLESEGRMLSNEQLAEYYNTFRNKFGPERLKNLDGEALLNTMHDFANRGSLVYWLEFKDDEEFPSRFGSISGGSAHKFGLFRKKETGKWTTGSSQNSQELSIEQAIDKARQHRDQLIKGIELLEKMPTNGTEEDYQQLQQDLNRVAPDLCDVAWGHKYFSLLFPEKLDGFHNHNYQHYHLIKLLQLPPQGEGRYIAGSRFVAIARELDILLNNLMQIMYARNGYIRYYWRIGTSDRAAPRNRWELMRERNCVAIGWDIGDLTEITNDKKGKEQIFQLLLARYSDLNHATAGKAAQQIFTFRWAIADNDLVLASDGATVLGIGRVTDDYAYKYDSSSDFPHHRSVEWLSLDEWQQPDQQPDIEGKLTTVYKMKRERNLLEAEKRIYGKEPIISTVPTIQSAVSATLHPSPPPPRLVGIPAHIQTILERKGQVILYGPPGTGKTYWAEYTARELAARANFNRTFEQLTDEQKALVLGTGDQHRGIMRMCSFHPAYGYEDFLEGFRPEPINGQMQFILRDGIFKKLCNDAETQPDHKFYLIIDEINRGDIPRIFGELLTVLEKDKRGKAILLPLTGRPFRVPSNIYHRHHEYG